MNHHHRIAGLGLIAATLVGCDRPAENPGPSDGVVAPAEPAAPDAADAADAADAVASGTAAPPATPAGSPLAFRELGAETGLDVIGVCGGMPTREILEVNGGGVALIDFDDDGDLDVFVAVGATLDDPTGGPGSRLFRNDGGLRFTDITAEAGITTRGWAFGVAVGDADGDGHDDLYITRHGTDVLLRNTGDGRFEDVTAASGLGQGDWATSAAFGDLDDDGDLDLFVVNYLAFDPAAPPPRASFLGVPVMGGPRGLAPTLDVVYENVGDGRFVDRTADWAIRPREAGFGLNAVIIDLDGDGTREVVVGNDSTANHVWRRVSDTAGPPRFTDVGLATGLATNGDGAGQATMGYAVADVNDDGRPDFFSTNFSSDTHTLHASTAADYHDDATRRFGLGIVTRPFLGWATWFADWDHDGDEDLLALHGHVYPEATPELMDSTWRQPPLLFARQGPRFERVEPPATVDAPGSPGSPAPAPADAWLATPRLDRAAAFGDLDGDGDVDAVVLDLNAPARILESLAADRVPGRGFTVHLRDERPGTPNHRGLGAAFTVTAGGVTRHRWLFTGGGFQSSSAPEVHVAVPEPGPVRIDVRWPDGGRQSVTVTEPGPRVVIRRAN
jgi:hypothetical protein